VAGAAESASGRRLSIGPLAVTTPAAIGMLVFFAAPLIALIVYSFLTAGLYNVSGPLTLDNYDAALSDSVNQILARNSLVVGLIAAAATLALGLPIAYWLRYAAGRWRTLVLFLVMATLFASYLVRIYAWRSILGERGLLNSGLQGIGLIDEPIGFLLYNRFSVVVALVHIFLPYVVLVLYAGFGPLSSSILEAAQDLGANAFTRWRKVILPLIAAPAVSSFLFVFVLSASDYVTPQLLGGTNGSLLGVQVQVAFKAVGNFALGAATGLIMLVAFVVFYAVTAFALRLAKLDRIRWTT
jgi:spermidine/putrescine transport system permease protein